MGLEMWISVPFPYYDHIAIGTIRIESLDIMTQGQLHASLTGLAMLTSSEEVLGNQNITDWQGLVHV